MTHGVVDQQLTNQMVDTDVGPTGAGHLAQVVTGPLALPQPTEHGAALSLTERLAVARREQELAVIASGILTVAVIDQQRADLLGQG
ncbi:hypothetical protein D3C87_1996040 [compost metagenome]